MKRQQKLYFYRQTTNLNEETRQNERCQEVLFAEWADIQNITNLEDLNGVQVVELSYTHEATTLWLPRIANDMTCYRKVVQPDRSVRNQYFKVIGFSELNQTSKYMVLKLSQIDDGGDA